MTRDDWRINIENVAINVEEKYGNEVVASVFRKYGASCFEDLSPTYYGEAFGDLMTMETDD